MTKKVIPEDNTIPMGKCQCGCGGNTTFIARRLGREGYAAGDYRKFLRGHDSRKRSGSLSPGWRGGRDGILQRKREKYREGASPMWKSIVLGYGGKCVVCGDNRIDALVLHHPNGDGKKNRQEMGEGMTFHGKLVKAGFPPIVELMCGSCHTIHHRVTEREKKYAEG